MPRRAFEASAAPLSVLAISRFIGPKSATAVADLAPIPLPQHKPDRTMLVAASYPSRAYAPSETGAAASALLARDGILVTEPATQPRSLAPVALSL